MVARGGIWGQTRSYGDTYHWAFHDGTVESVSAVPVFFSGGVSRGQGTKSKQIFPSPAAQSFLVNGRKHCVLSASGNFGCGCAALSDMRAKIRQNG